MGVGTEWNENRDEVGNENGNGDAGLFNKHQDSATCLLNVKTPSACLINFLLQPRCARV